MALMLVGLALAVTAPVTAEDSHGDLGESAGMQPTEKSALSLMRTAQKIWEKGERPDGSESVSKMEGALDHQIDKSMHTVEEKVEHKIEETAIKGNEPHPMQFAKDEAKQVVRGIKDSERLVGDDVAEFNKGYTQAKSYAKSQGGGVIPDLGAEVDAGLNTEFQQAKVTDNLRKAMETYVPKSVSLVELDENQPSKEAIHGAKQDQEALGKPALAAKYVAEVEHIPVEQVLGKKAAPKEAAAAKKEAPDAPAAPKEEPARTASGMPNAKKYIDEVMNKVQGDVDIQFAPVEEQLGYNLHQEVKLAQHQGNLVKDAAKTDQGIAQRQKDFRQANQIALVAKNAEAEALKMKKAVNKAKAEHASNGEEVSLIELGESAQPSLHEVIQAKAIKMVKQNQQLQDDTMKAMKKAEAEINTEFNPILPVSMLPQSDAQAKSILYHTMPLVSAKVEKEAALLKKLTSTPELAADQAPPVEELIEEGETAVPQGYNPYDKQVDVNFKINEVLVPNAASHVETALNKEAGLDAVMQKITEAAVEKTEAQMHDDFQGLGGEHSYSATKQLNKSVENLGNEVTSARIQAAERVEEGRLPNGQKIQLQATGPLDG